MADMLQRLFGIGKSKQRNRDPFTYSVSPDGKERVQYYEDLSHNAAAARWNMEQIYGSSSVPPTFGMRPVIEVKNKQGEWQPVSGSLAMVPDMDAQIAYLRSYRESGIIGAQPVNPDGSMYIDNGKDKKPGETTGNPTAPDKNNKEEEPEWLAPLREKLDTLVSTQSAISALTSEEITTSKLPEPPQEEAEKLSAPVETDTKSKLPKKADDWLRSLPPEVAERIRDRIFNDTIPEKDLGEKLLGSKDKQSSAVPPDGRRVF